jgi:hypothetical protein
MCRAAAELDSCLRKREIVLQPPAAVNRTTDPNMRTLPCSQAINAQPARDDSWSTTRLRVFHYETPHDSGIN